MTLKEMGKTLGVSPSTISKVLNNSPNFSIPQELRERILDHVDRCGYSPNPIFRSMRINDNKQLACFFYSRSSLSTGSTVEISVDAAITHLEGLGYEFYYQFCTRARKSGYPQPNWKVAGILIPDVISPSQLTALEQRGQLYVTLNGVCGPEGTAVQSDETQNMTLALEQLRQLGHRRIAYVSPDCNELDDSGYLTTPLADLAMSCDADLEELEAALHYVQSLDPAGVGARSLGECLRLQLERSGRLTPLLAAVLDNGLDDVARNRLPALAHRLRVPLDELKAALEELRRLDPAPGRRLTTTTAECIRPEVEIRRGDHGFEAVPLDDRERRLIINPVYRELLDTADLAAADRSYLREKLQRAREFIQALEQRRSTILRLAEVIASEQGPFMEHGVEALRPMTMKQAAARLGVHETTVSRAAAEKYILTPQGIFPFKFFFSGKVAAAGTDAGELSNRAVMERIRELIAAEDPKHPLSDEKIAAALTAGGVAIARRTVAKYRESMKIPPTNLRRRH